MWDRQRQAWAIVFLCNILINATIATPIYVPQFVPGSTGRNIRHLPCVSRRTGETGVCMFAFTCAKANGTHLGTCIDRFYFGSCCKIDEDPYVYPQDNSIDDGPPARPLVSTDLPIESNDIPEYISRPKPSNERKPPVSNTVETTTKSSPTTQTVASTVRATTKIATKKPIIATIETTTESIRLSTFQSIQNASKVDSITEKPFKNVTTVVISSEKPSSSVETTIITKRPSKPTSPVTPRPTTLETVTQTSSTSQTLVQTTKPVTKKPTHPPTIQKPTHTTTQKPTTSTTRKPVHTTQSLTTESTTSKTVTTTTQRTVPATRFPPRNTTSVKPLTHATTKRPITSTRKPVTSTSTKRPTVTTKKPSSPTKRPASSKPTTVSNLSGTSAGTTVKPATTISKIKPSIVPTTESSLPSAQETSISTSAITVSTVQKTTKRPDQKTTTLKPTTFKTTTPRPPSTTVKTKPTKIGTTTTNAVEYSTVTEETRPVSSTEASTVGLTKPRPTESTKPLVKPVTKPSTKPTIKPTTKPLVKPTSKPTTTTTTTTTSTTTVSSLATSTASSVTVPLLEATTSSYEPSTKITTTNQTTQEVTQTTYSPGIVTWTSSSDNAVTKTPEVTSTTEKEQTDSEWTPITTPDGWIMIQSPTTEKSTPIPQESTTKPISEPTLQSTTSAQQTTESTTDYVTKRPTTLTTLSTIASVTIDTELPVPMETLNLSDYKQVCGRRLFPESRIVGGNASSFGKWPWQISLRQWRTSTYLHKCGAALLNENWAITAAHCVENVPPSDLLLRVGEHDLSNEDEPYGYQERRVQIVASHPQFDPRTFEYDLALLRFYEPLSPFQPNVIPICLPDDDESYVGRTAYVTGWGRLYDEGPLPSILQEVAVPVINNTKCEGMYRRAGYIEHIPHIFICAGWEKGGFDSCEGDSGGPMVIQRARDKRWVLAGVISWGIGCAAPNQPGVYTRISEFREWINQILQF